MSPSRHNRRPHPITVVGLVLLIVASVVHFLIGHDVLPQGAVPDLVQGLLYGAAIAAMLLGTWRRSRPCRPERTPAG